MPDNPEEFFDKITKVTVEQILSIILETSEFKFNIPIGYTVKGEVNDDSKKKDPTLPTYLSVCILAYARRRMSKATRVVNGYFNPLHTVLYTDTDSMVIRESTYKVLKQKGYIGSNLGQLEDELPNDYIVAARFLAPKCYCLGILKKDKQGHRHLAYKVRCKGIPHRGDVFFDSDYYTSESRDRSLTEYLSRINGPVENLKNCYYCLKAVNKETHKDEMLNYLSIQAFDAILSQTHYVECHFGSILRGRESSGEAYGLRTQWCHRVIGKISWWNTPERCSRVVKEDDSKELRQVSLCKGYVEQRSQVVVEETQNDVIIPIVLMEEDEYDLNNFNVNLDFTYNYNNEDTNYGFIEHSDDINDWMNFNEF